MYSAVAREESRRKIVCVWGGGDRVACGVGPYVRGGGGMKKKKKNILTCCGGGGLMRGLFTMKLGGIWVLTGFGVGRAILKKIEKKIKKKLDKQRKV